VLASDGLIYDNACFATRAGHAVIRRVDPRTLKGLGQSGGFGTALAVLAAVMLGGLWLAASGKRKRA